MHKLFPYLGAEKKKTRNKGIKKKKNTHHKHTLTENKKNSTEQPNNKPKENIIDNVTIDIPDIEIDEDDKDLL